VATDNWVYEADLRLISVRSWETTRGQRRDDPASQSAVLAVRRGRTASDGDHPM